MSAANRNFARHYAEMVVVMFLGMAVLGLPAEMGLRAVGSSSDQLHADSPALLLLGMAAIMTAPMVAWMRYRGHAWLPSAEMAASMFLPTLAAIGLLGAGAMDGMGAMGFQHVAMLPSMLVAMLLRRDEYSHAHRQHREVPA